MSFTFSWQPFNSCKEASIYLLDWSTSLFSFPFHKNVHESLSSLSPTIGCDLQSDFPLLLPPLTSYNKFS